MDAWARLRNREDGQALVAGLGISLVLVLLITTLLAVVRHADDATVRDRSRTQGVQSAEAAVSVALDGLARRVCVPDIGMSVPESLVVDGKTVGQYRAIVRLPAEAGVLEPTQWNPNLTASPGCTTNPPAGPERVITAWGYGPSASSGHNVLRKLEVHVRVSPLAGFRFVCLAGGAAPNGELAVKNNFTANGNCYARTVSESHNNLVANGTLVSPGSITTKSNTAYQGNLWAGGAIVVGNGATITGYTTSSTSSVHLQENARVLGNATAGTTLTLDNNAIVYGTRCPASPGAPGCPTTAPPVLDLPALKCAPTDSACWLALYPGMTSMTAAQLSAHLAATQTSLSGSYLVTDAATVDFTKGGTIAGPLTIVTRGRIEVSRDLVTQSPSTAPAACTGTPGPRTCIVTLVSTSTESDAIRVKAPRFTANQATISVLLFTKGTIQVDGGANPTSFSGSIYGANLTIDSNGMTVTQSQDLVDHAPGFVDWPASSSLQFTVEPTAWRELTPVPPA